ncbi:MAG: SDR family oxidoreductase, partial [Pseudomonadota bacterium]|nr:SDR family oxidoreductase [Pseudomonadota bacterium]
EQIDILINNSGGPPPTPVLGVDLNIWRRYFESLILSIIRINDALIPGMRLRGWGRVLSVLSTGVVQPIPTLVISNSLRSVLLAWSKTLAREVAADGVTMNTIAPGRIATERIRELDEATALREKLEKEEVRAINERNLPIGRYGEIDEFASVAVFLVSQSASYLTGQFICVDGGLVAGI